MSDLDYDSGWDLVGHFERAIEDAAEEPHLPPAEHALMAAEDFERTWLAAHDREVAANALREASLMFYPQWKAAQPDTEKAMFFRLQERADRIERGGDV